MQYEQAGNYFRSSLLTMNAQKSVSGIFDV